MPLYESVFIARQDISAPQVEALADDFAKIIEDQGGRIAKREHWGLRSLAYRIKKNRKGHYVLFNMESPAEAVQEMERQMSIHEDVLRYLTLKMDELDPEPSVIMQRGARDDRDRPRHRPDEDARPKEASPAPEKPETDEKPAQKADKSSAEDTPTEDKPAEDTPADDGGKADEGEKE